MATIILVGVVTWYGGIYYDQPLYCSTFDNPLYFDRDPVYTWIAWDFGTYGGQCGDVIAVYTDDRQVHRFRALDSGPFGAYCVQEGADCIPIVADVPEPFVWWYGLSTHATVVNESEYDRRYAGVLQ